DDDYEEFTRNLINPIEHAKQDYRQRLNRDLSLNGALNWMPTDNLVFRSELAFTLRNTESKRYWGPLTGESRNAGNNKPLGELTLGESDTYRWINTANIKLKKTKNSKLNLLLGQEINTTSGNTVFNRAKEFDVNILPERLFTNMALGTVERLETRETRGGDLLSFFGRVNYIFKDKYIFYGTLRADGSSLFAPGNRWGYFPAASFAWRASDEEFISKINVFSDLKFRLSYGEAGNNRVPNDAWRLLFEPSGNRPYGAGNLNQTYYGVVNNTLLPNPDLRWETTVSRNLGIDFGFFKNRITGTLDAYWNTTKDLIVRNEIPPHSGFSFQQLNIGQTSNKGVELSLNGTIIDKKDFRLTGSFNIGRNIPRVDKLDGNDTRLVESNWAGGDLRYRDDYRLITGETIGLMYGFVSDGFYKTDDFESYNATTNTYLLKDGVPNGANVVGGIIGTRPGTMKLKDLNNDGVITDQDRQIIGNAIAKHTGGFGLNATYKSFDLSTFFNWVYGNDVYNTGRIQFNMYYRSTYGNLLNTSNYDNRFKYIDGNGQLVRGLEELAALNQDATIWSPFSMGSAAPVFSDDAVEDGSFFRMTYITLGYTLPKTFTSRFGVSSLRLFGTVYNAFLLTNYSGYDPEVTTTRSNTYGALTPGVDYSSYPKSRTFTFGLNVNF
ncbi:MAG: SusC/RagA family TonB-linked outer membrane protein, partial [Pedobacter sp.]